MCGIAGLYGLEKAAQPEEMVQRMVQCMHHRGPDAHDTLSVGNAVLGHARLSIVDLDPRANQPMVDGDIYLIFNGEIYNHKHLRELLKADHTFVTTGDTEVIIKAYKQWGMDMVHQLEGMFAFALYDSTKQTLFLCRDRLGIKPLYVARTASGIAFASEVRPLMKSGAVPKRLNKVALSEYLRYQTVHEPNTLIENVSMLPAGTYVQFSDTDERSTTYWQPENVKQQNPREAPEKKVRELLEDAVSKRMMADVPLGAFLSGGIDSSAVVGLMASQSDTPINTFSVGFKEAEFSEHQYAKIVADKFGTKHHEITLTSDDFKHSLPEAVSGIDHPSGDGPNTWVVSRETKKQGITVALSGLGGDEIFGGYPFFNQIRTLRDRKGLLSFPKDARKLAAKAAIAVKGEQLWKLKDYAALDYWDVPHAYAVNRKILPENWVDRILSKDVYQKKDAFGMALVSRYAWGTPAYGLDQMAQASLAELTAYMRHVLLRDADQMSMAHSLEIRVPFLDHKLVSYVMSLPEQLKFGKAPKDLLVRSLSDLLPDDIVYRKKMGFTLPWEQWLRGDLKPYAEVGLQYLKTLEQYFDSQGIDDVWNAFLSGNKAITWARVWPLIALGHWCKAQEIE